jgi:glutamate N-acetyltransferase/amino-acid N-acetyltransferase
VGGKTVTLSAIIKGSGMIAPDMATMLGYIFTDCAINPVFLQELLSKAADETFNCITVDPTPPPATPCWPLPPARRATAPSTAKAARAPMPLPPRWMCAANWRIWWCAMARARKVHHRKRQRRGSDERAPHRPGHRQFAAGKTAIAGEDANWGRVVMAVGKAGEPADRDRLSIGFGGTWQAKDGQPLPDYDEAPVAAHLKGAR